jgi:hypothetical protein
VGSPSGVRAPRPTHAWPLDSCHTAALRFSGYIDPLTTPEPQRFTDAWTRRDLGTQVRPGAYLVGTLQNYDPSAYPPATLVFDALDECNQLWCSATVGRPAGIEHG